jgi:hypothetical protein
VSTGYQCLYICFLSPDSEIVVSECNLMKLQQIVHNFGNVFVAIDSAELSNRMVPYSWEQKVSVIKIVYFSGGSCLSMCCICYVKVKGKVVPVLN